MCDIEYAPPRPGVVQHHLGPLLFRVRAQEPFRARLMATVALAGCCSLLGLAAWMHPDPRGLGTHKQLGLPPCSSVMLLGYPCPTCGMTTAFSYTVRGRFVAAFHAQPAGFLLAMATAVIAGVALSVIATGRVWTVNWYRVSPAKMVIALISILVGGWLYKLIVSL